MEGETGSTGGTACENLISFTPVSFATCPLLTTTASVTALAMSAARSRSADVPVTAIIGESGEVSDRTWVRSSRTVSPAAPLA